MIHYVVLYNRTFLTRPSGNRILLTMSVPILRAIASHPIGSLLISTAVALLLGSLATAGLNTLLLARLMIAASFLICVSIVFYIAKTKRFTRRNRLLAAVALLAIHVGLERAETWYMPKPRRLPVPPLLLESDDDRRVNELANRRREQLLADPA